MAINVLYDNCRSTWPKTVCGFSNVCGYISNTIWFVVLVPQIWKNWKRRSVEGLSILWATANFTGSLVNCFFAFTVGPLPLYIKISAVYMPVLEFCILVQFWFYSKHTVQMKVSYGAGCFLIWIVVITLELLVENAAENVQWIAIVLWSIESFPQVGVMYVSLKPSRKSSQVWNSQLAHRLVMDGRTDLQVVVRCKKEAFQCSLAHVSSCQ